MKSAWNRTHPNALLDLDLSFLSSWKDITWESDSCPSFIYVFDQDKTLQLYLDYADIKMRDNEELKRFYLREVITNEEEDYDNTSTVDLYYGESLADLITIITEYLT